MGTFDIHKERHDSAGIRSGLIAVLLVAVLAMGGCANLSPFQEDPTIRHSEPPLSTGLQNLPAPAEEMVAAVYRFRDQTGQYEPSENIASWSTAVTQGGTSILMKAIDDSGWFVPIEREGISNLMNERQIIRSIRSEHGQEGPLPPLMYAGVMLEGGIIGYDSNIMTGGAGARYLGIGGSTEFRQDKVTIYLRVVSTQNSRVLKTVHATETILSQKVDASVFRFVDENKILEGEAGYTVNEPGTVAVTRAIEKAVEKLIMEGIRDGLWGVHEEEDPAYVEEAFAAYDERQMARTSIDFFGRELRDRRGTMGLGLNLDGQRYRGNFEDPLPRPSTSLQMLLRLSQRLFVDMTAHRGALAARQGFEYTYSGADLSLKGLLHPDRSLTPYAKLGAGMMGREESAFRYSGGDWFPYLNAAIGLEYMMWDGVGVNLSVNHRYALKDGLDGREMGRYNDHVWSIGGGFVFYRF